jgi:hypothetical protein
MSSPSGDASKGGFGRPLSLQPTRRLPLLSIRGESESAAGHHLQIQLAVGSHAMQSGRPLVFGLFCRWASLSVAMCLAAGGAVAARWTPPEGWSASVTNEGERYRWSSGATSHHMEAFRSAAFRLHSDSRSGADAALARWLDEQVRRDAPAHGEGVNCMPAVIKQLGAQRAVALSQCTGRDRQQMPMRLQYLGVADAPDDGTQRGAQQSAVFVRVLVVGDDAGLAAQRPQLDAVMSHLLWPPQ